MFPGKNYNLSTGVFKDTIKESVDGHVTFLHFVSCQVPSSVRLLSPFPVILGDIMVNVIVTGSKVRGFKLGQTQGIFKGDKNSHHAFLGRESKAVGPPS
jgi:hypothetical protein